MIKTIIGVVGCGNMGGAIVRGIVCRGVVPASDVYVYDLNEDKALALAEETGIHRADLKQTVRVANILFIAVKPVDFTALAEDISADIVEQTIVSVMAGVNISEIKSCFNKSVAVVRAMPNLPACVKQAVTCLASGENARIKGTLEKVGQIFSCIGDVVNVDEKDMDLVTALSGSGPAYLFALADAMLDAALEGGMDENTARKLISGTLFGSSVLLRTSKCSAGELINKVASKGGTTEAALSVFRERSFKGIVKEAVKKANVRSVEMSGRGMSCS